MEQKTFPGSAFSKSALAFAVLAGGVACRPASVFLSGRGPHVDYDTAQPETGGALDPQDETAETQDSEGTTDSEGTIDPGEDTGAAGLVRRIHTNVDFCLSLPNDEKGKTSGRVNVDRRYPAEEAVMNGGGVFGDAFLAHPTGKEQPYLAACVEFTPSGGPTARLGADLLQNTETGAVSVSADIGMPHSGVLVAWIVTVEGTPDEPWFSAYTTPSNSSNADRVYSVIVQGGETHVYP